MTNSYPLPREIRETDAIVGDGRASYGPFAFRVWDVGDLRAFVTRAGALTSSELVVAQKVDGQPFDHFTVRFDPPLMPGDRAIVQSRRLHERLTDVIRGGTISGTGLERELSSQTTVIQELRRDVSRGGSVVAGDMDQALVFDAEGNVRPGRNIEAEAVAWRDADAERQDDIAIERSTRIAADVELQANIDALERNHLAFVTEDDRSVRIEVSSALVVVQATSPFPSVTLRLVTP